MFSLQVFRKKNDTNYITMNYILYNLLNYINFETGNNKNIMRL